MTRWAHPEGIHDPFLLLASHIWWVQIIAGLWERGKILGAYRVELSLQDFIYYPAKSDQATAFISETAEEGLTRKVYAW
jgi:hypothetical protein